MGGPGKVHVQAPNPPLAFQGRSELAPPQPVSSWRHAHTYHTVSYSDGLRVGSRGARVAGGFFFLSSFPFLFNIASFREVFFLSTSSLLRLGSSPVRVRFRGGSCSAVERRTPGVRL